MTEENSVSGAQRSTQPQINQSDASNYWRENIQLLVKLLVVWFVASFGCGILFVEELNQFSFFGMQLGFWFAQQGSIYVFIVLIFTYVVRMKKIEQRYGVDDSTELDSTGMNGEQSQ